jgi:hypothetical protein
MAEVNYVGVNLGDLITDGLYYLWSPYQKRPCILSRGSIKQLASEAPIDTDAIFAVNSKRLAKQFARHLANGTRNVYPVRHLNVAMIEPVLQRWQADGYHWLVFPGADCRKLTHLNISELLKLLKRAIADFEQRLREQPPTHDGQHRTGN